MAASSTAARASRALSAPLAPERAQRNGKLQTQANLQLMAGPGMILDEMAFRLLQGIQFSGCLVDAGRLAGIPYRTAYDRLHNLAQAWGAPLVRTISGGSRGGRSTLTEDGEHLLSLYSSLRREHETCLELLNQRLEREWNRPRRVLEEAP